MTLVAAMVITMTSCQKEQITPSNPEFKSKPIDCKRCDGDWDLIDTTAVNQ